MIDMSVIVAPPEKTWYYDLLNLLNVLADPKSPLIWVLSGIGVYYALKATSCRFFGKFCDKEKPIKCKDARIKLKETRKDLENAEKLLGQRGSRIVKLERRNDVLEHKLKDCVQARIRVLSK
jgi:hypothetical protein